MNKPKSNAGMIQFMATSIYIARNMKNTVLETLLIDYAREKNSKMIYLMIRILAHKYQTDMRTEDIAYHNIIKRYLTYNSSSICKELLYK